jgi:hypothetical protein
MFFPGSRYINQPTYPVTRANGTVVQAVRIPLPGPALLMGYVHQSLPRRLDLIVSRFLADATTFWRLCDANNSVVPDVLAARDLIGIPIDAPGAR